MIEMTNGINRASFGGARVVTCYSCHRGTAVPPNTPALPFPQTQPARSVSAPLPSVDEILAKYIAALGGEKALLGARSRVITATQDIPTGPGGTVTVAATIEEYRKAPDRALSVAKASGAVYTTGFDGERAWTKDAKGRVSSPANLDQVRAKLGADFYEPLDIAREYARLKVVGIEKVGPKDAFVIGMRKSRQSRRMVPTSRSQYAFGSSDGGRNMKNDSVYTKASRVSVAHLAF